MFDALMFVYMVMAVATSAKIASDDAAPPHPYRVSYCVLFGLIWPIILFAVFFEMDKLL